MTLTILVAFALPDGLWRGFGRVNVVKLPLFRNQGVWMVVTMVNVLGLMKVWKVYRSTTSDDADDDADDVVVEPSRDSWPLPDQSKAKDSVK